MTKALVASKQYSKIQKAIAEELTSGAERVRRSYKEEVVRTVWNIGKILRGSLGLEDHPSAANAALVARLSRDLGRPGSFFYDAAKFHRFYPERTPLDLSWSHYSLLIRLKDPGQRRVLEKKAITQQTGIGEFRLWTRAPYGLTHPNPGLGFEKSAPGSNPRAVLSVTRGRLHYYQTTQAPKDGRVLIDIGFGIEREVRSKAKETHRAGVILRTILNRENYDTRLSSFDKTRLYTYAATLVRVIDGDTILARVDLGFRTWILETFRLRGIDTPELTCTAGKRAKTEVAARLKPCACLVIKSYKQEKYGRYLADVFYQKEAGEDRERILNEGAFLNQELLNEGLATPYYEP